MKQNPNGSRMSRRDFTKSAALTAAAAALPAQLIAQQEKPPTPTPAPVKPPESPAGPKLSDAAKREVDLKIQSVMDRHGSRLTEAQKADIRKAVASTQEGLETLRAFAIENADEPATVLHFSDTNGMGGARR